MTFLAVNNLSKRYPKAQGPALDDFSVMIKKGQRLAVIGESGSGKSTLLRIIAGLEVADHGSVTFKGQAVLDPTQKLVAGQDDIQLIHQQFKLHPFSTAAENIRRPLLLYDKEYARERTDFLLRLFGLADKKDRIPKELSGGEQQKVAIARSLSLEPELLLLDEPFSNLDIRQKRGLLEELEEIFDEIGLTVLLVTHDLEDALAVAEELCVIRAGKLVQRGTANELYRNPENHYVASLFSRLNPLPNETDKYLRPQHIRVDESGHVLTGKIVKCQFHLLYNRLTVSIANSPTTWTVFDEKRTLHVGDNVNLSYSGEDILQIAEE
nr:ATP-binding cassette domain-containing protein [Cytophagales bacterium]